MKILLIEDEKITRISLTETLTDEGYEVMAAETGSEGLLLLKGHVFDVVVTDLRLPKMSGIDILKFIRQQSPETRVIVITAFATVETAIEALKQGAYDYLVKPFSPDKLLSTLNHIRQLNQIEDENKVLKSRLQRIENKIIIGSSEPIQKVKETIQAIADNDFSVLIQGESGTGKEIAARSLHFGSHRSDKPFIAVNCAAIPETLLESELFGYEKGAFTGADKQHPGYFERAGSGTIFIDDIDDLPLPLQVKLLRVLQEKEFTRVGGIKEIKLKARIICATKIDLKELVNLGKFRKDLFYRLNIIPLVIPPLRERKEDIPQLIEHFFIKYNAGEKMTVLSKDILNILSQHRWSGNVRELENTIERIIALSGMKNWEEIVLTSLSSADAPGKEETPIPHHFDSYEEFLKEKERELFRWALDQANQNISKAAQLLNLPRSTFRSKIAKNQKHKKGE